MFILKGKREKGTLAWRPAWMKSVLCALSWWPVQYGSTTSTNSSLTLIFGSVLVSLWEVHNCLWSSVCRMMAWFTSLGLYFYHTSIQLNVNNPNSRGTSPYRLRGLWERNAFCISLPEFCRASFLEVCELLFDLWLNQHLSHFSNFIYGVAFN